MIRIAGKSVVLGRKGLTLVEVLIAMVVFLLVSLAMMQTALVGIDSNMISILRDEAVNIAEERISAIRNVPYDSYILADTNGTPNDRGDFVSDVPPIYRNIRNISNFSFTSQKRVDDIGNDTKQVEIQIIWAWKEKTLDNDPYSHTITTIVRER